MHPSSHICTENQLLNFTDLGDTICGSIENDTAGWIGFFRDIPFMSNDFYNCLWTIIAKENFSVLLRILSVKVDWSPGCEDNYLTVGLFGILVVHLIYCARV